MANGGKIKVFIYGDVNTKTGFGNIIYKIINGLHKLGMYEIVALGTNYHGEPHNLPCHVYPIDSSDVYGQNLFPRYVLNEKPDIIFALQDLFILKNLVDARDKYFPHVPMVGYYPVDGNNMHPDWINCIVRLDSAVTYSRYGLELTKWYIPHIQNLHMVYHGIDTNVFKILPVTERDQKRSQLGWSDKFVVGVFNRYQPRKMVHLLMRAFALFRQGYKECKQCGNYYHLSEPKCDLNFCDAENSVIHAGHDNVALYLHMNQEEHLMGGNNNSLDKASISVKMWETKGVNFLPGVDIYSDMSPDQAELVRLYNACDAYISGTIGEGFGLTAVEAMACGLPVALPVNTTAPEFFSEGRGYLVPSTGFVSMPFDSAHLRPVFHGPSMVDTLNTIYAKWKEEGYKPNWGNHFWVKKNLNWGNIINQFHEILMETHRRKKQQMSSITMEVFQ